MLRVLEHTAHIVKMRSFGSCDLMSTNLEPGLNLGSQFLVTDIAAPNQHRTRCGSSLPKAGDSVVRPSSTKKHQNHPVKSVFRPFASQYRYSDQTHSGMPVRQ